MVQSHLVQYGFVKDYTVWTFHGEADLDVSAGAFGGNSSTSMATVTTENDGGQQQPSSSVAAGAGGHGVAGDNADHDYIRMQDDGGGDGGSSDGDGE